MVYLLLILICLAGIVLFDGRPLNRAGVSVYWSLCLLCALVAGLRYRVGIDTVFDEYVLLCRDMGMEWGEQMADNRFSPVYLALVSLGREFTDMMWPVQTVMALILNFAIFYYARTIHREIGNRLFLFIALYLVSWYLLLSFESARQGMAVAFFLLAWLQLRKRHYVWYAVFIVCAILCHRFAFVTIFFAIAETGWFRRITGGGRGGFQLKNLLWIAGLISVLYILRIIMMDLLPALELPKPYDKAFTGINFTLSNWKGTVVFLILNAVYPALAMIWLRRVNPIVMLTIILNVAAAGTDIGYRTYYFLFIFIIEELVICVARRRRALPVYVWVLLFLPYAGRTGYKLCMSHEWPDGKMHRKYEYYLPYSSVLRPEDVTVREMRFIQYFEADNCWTPVILSRSLREEGSLTDEEQEWVERLYEKNYVEGDDYSYVQKYMEKVRMQSQGR